MDYNNYLITVAQTPISIKPFTLENFNKTLFKHIGTVPELEVVDKNTLQCIDWEHLDIITKIPNKFWNQLSDVRMSLNILHGEFNKLNRN